MKKWLRNLALGTLVAGAGVGYEYSRYKTPEILNVKTVNKYGDYIVVQRSKSNIVFDNLEKLLGKHDRGSYVYYNVIPDKYHANVEIQPMERSADFTSSNWDSFEQNSMLNRGDPEWSAEMQIVYNAFSNIPLSQIRKIKLDSLINGTIIHEEKHLNQKRSGSGDNSEDIDRDEFEAYLVNLENYPSYLKDIVHTSIQKSDSHGKNASKRIISELTSYPDTPGLWELTHLDNFNGEISRRAKEIRLKYFK